MWLEQAKISVVVHNQEVPPPHDWNALQNFSNNIGRGRVTGLLRADIAWSSSGRVENIQLKILSASGSKFNHRNELSRQFRSYNTLRAPDGFVKADMQPSMGIYGSRTMSTSLSDLPAATRERLADYILNKISGIARMCQGFSCQEVTAALSTSLRCIGDVLKSM